MKTNTLKIAIIDNDDAIGGIYKQYFQENEQYELHGVYSSVHRLLSDFGRSHPDIIICEAMLNGISGIDGLEYFYRKNKDLKVLMMSHKNDFKLIKEAFKKGASGYLIKPITKERLFSALDALTNMVLLWNWMWQKKSLIRSKLSRLMCFRKRKMRSLNFLPRASPIK